MHRHSAHSRWVCRLLEGSQVQLVLWLEIKTAETSPEVTIVHSRFGWVVREVYGWDSEQSPIPEPALPQSLGLWWRVEGCKASAPHVVLCQRLSGWRTSFSSPRAHNQCPGWAGVPPSMWRMVILCVSECTVALFIATSLLSDDAWAPLPKEVRHCCGLLSLGGWASLGTSTSLLCRCASWSVIYKHWTCAPARHSPSGGQWVHILSMKIPCMHTLFQ